MCLPNGRSGIFLALRSRVAGFGFLVFVGVGLGMGITLVIGAALGTGATLGVGAALVVGAALGSVAMSWAETVTALAPALSERSTIPTRSPPIKAIAKAEATTDTRPTCVQRGSFTLSVCHQSAQIIALGSTVCAAPPWWGIQIVDSDSLWGTRKEVARGAVK